MHSLIHICLQPDLWDCSTSCCRCVLRIILQMLVKQFYITESSDEICSILEGRCVQYFRALGAYVVNLYSG